MSPARKALMNKIAFYDAEIKNTKEAMMQLDVVEFDNGAQMYIVIMSPTHYLGDGELTTSPIEALKYTRAEIDAMTRSGMVIRGRALASIAYKSYINVCADYRSMYIAKKKWIV